MAFDPITAGFNFGKDLVNTLGKWIPDATKANEAAAELAGQFNSLVAGQIELNKIEAQSTSLFVAGWRPAIGWICASAYAYNFVVQPVLTFILLAMGVMIPTLPVLDWTELSIVMMGMLGLGGMRSFDKLKGTSK